MSLRFFQGAAALALVIGLVLLTLTAAPSILHGAQLSGYGLIAHISLSPIYVIAFLAYMFMSSPRLDALQSTTLKSLLSFLYLLALASTFAAIAIIPLTMLPLVSTDWLEWLLLMHQRCAIVMVVSVLIYLSSYSLSRSRFFQE
ncbi:MAG: hypothetical protein P9L94_04065 [Candidatus Hinthialibacter antarcticus]|nr:hypothetical protein [Candidatus Hinthialibacter antarcticus]